MQHLKFILTGVVFGIMFVKAEVVSWFRIYEMFRFESFHMYGIIGSAVVLTIIITWFIKKEKVRDMYGNDILFLDKMKTWPRYIIGGILFGLGWAMTGACPGPMFTLVGAGYPVMIMVILSAIAGTWTYGALRGKLPH